MAEPEVSVKIVANDQTAAGTESAKANFDQLDQHVSDSAANIAELAGEIFAADKIKDFAEEAVLDFAKVERGMDQLGAQVKANGENWAEAQEKAEGFLDAERNLYGFSTGNLEHALTNAELKIGDMGAAMKAVDLAGKLAASGIGDLESNTNLLSTAYQGNSRSLMALGRELGLTKEQASGSSLVFETLEKKVKNVGDVTGDTQAKIDSMRTGWEQFTENIGRQLAPLIPVFSTFEKTLEQVISQIFTMGKVVVDLVAIPIENLIDGVTHSVEAFHALGNMIHAAAYAMTGEWGKAADEFKAGTAQMKLAAKGMVTDIGNNFKNNLVKDVKDGSAEVERIWADTTKKTDLMSDTAFKKGAARHTAKVKESKDETKATEDSVKAQTVAETNYYQKITANMESISSLAETTSAEMVKAYEAGTLSVASAFEILGKAIFKALVMATGEALVQQGAADLAKAAAAVLTGVEAVAAPGYMAAGLELEAAGGTIMGVAQAALADGAVVTAPTVVLAGEGPEPEAVLPLSKLSAMLGGTGGSDQFHVHQHFAPGTTQAQAQKLGQTSARAFFSEWQATKTRSGYKNSGF